MTRKLSNPQAKQVEKLAVARSAVHDELENGNHESAMMWADMLCEAADALGMYDFPSDLHRDMAAEYNCFVQEKADERRKSA